MNAPRYFGNAEEFLHAWAMLSRERPELGLQCGRSFERCAEDLRRAEDVADLHRRDLHREIEELENEVTRLTK